MMFALGAVSSALDALQSLTSKSSSAQSTGFGQNAANPFDFATTGASTPAGSSGESGSAGFSQISPQTMSALIAAQSQSSTGSASQSPSSALKDLFSQVDADGDGKITKSEFENALGAGGTNLAMAGDVFRKLDKNGDGSVSLDEMKSALQGGRSSSRPSPSCRKLRRFELDRRRRLERRSAAAGARRRVLHQLGQQRRLDHDRDHVCRRLQGDDDHARRLLRVELGDDLLQFHRADDPARGAGARRFGRLHAVGERVGAI